MGGRADNDAVIVLGKALELHQRLAAAVRARAEIRVLDALAGECSDNFLRTHGLQMLPTPTEIDDLLWVPRCEICVTADMAGIG